MLETIGIRQGLWANFGSVGSGKTLFSAHIAKQAIKSGWKVVVASAESRGAFYHKAGLVENRSLYWVPRTRILDETRPEFLRFLRSGARLIVIDDFDYLRFGSSCWQKARQFALDYNLLVLTSSTPRRATGRIRLNQLPSVCERFADVITIQGQVQFKAQHTPARLDFRLLKHREMGAVSDSTLRFNFEEVPLVRKEEKRLNRYDVLADDD